MNEDLKWLAENVDVVESDRWYANINGELRSWPAKCQPKTPHAFKGSTITAARDELSGKPGWDEHNHNFICQNNNGRWFGYDIEPVKNERDQCWTHKDMDFMWQGRRHKLGQGKAIGDWRNTLERRPMGVKQAFEKMREIGGFDVEKSLAYTNCDAPTEWRGPEDGLPPFGSRVEAWFDDGGVCWHEANVIGRHPSEENTAAVSLIGDHESRLIWADKSGLRPIRTEQQKAVDEMFTYIQIGMTPEEILRALYAAGYKRG